MSKTTYLKNGSQMDQLAQRGMLSTFELWIIRSSNLMFYQIGRHTFMVMSKYVRDSSNVHEWLRYQSSQVQPKLRNINLHGIIHPLISWNSREQMFVVRISLPIVTFLSLISWIMSLMHTPKNSTHTLALRHVSICGVSSSSYATCWMLVHAYVTSHGKVKRSGPHQRM